MRAAAGLAAAFLVLHLLLPGRFYSDDALDYALRMARTDLDHPGFWLPQHPLWTPLGSALFHLYRMVGYSGGPLEIVQTVNAVAGAGALLVFFLLLRRLGAGEPAALIGTALLAANFGFWAFAGDVKMYAVAALALFAALLNAHRPVVGGLLMALAMLFHITSIYALPALLLASPRPLRTGCVFLGAVLAGYGLCFLPIRHTFDGSFWDWLSFPARSPAPWLLYRGPLPDRVALFLQRVGSSVTGAGWTGMVTHMLPPGPEPAWWRALQATSALYGPFLLAGLAVAALRAPRTRGAAVLALWLVASVLGYAIVTADNSFVWILFAPLAGLAALAATNGTTRGALAAAAAVLLAVNLLARVLPAADPRNNPALVEATAARTVLAPDDLVVTFIDNGYYEYFARVPVLPLYRFFQDFYRKDPYGRLEQVLQAVPGRVFLTRSTVENPFVTNPPPERMGLRQDEILAFLRARYRLEPEAGTALYRLIPTEPRSTTPPDTGTSRSSSGL